MPRRPKNEPTPEPTPDPVVVDPVVSSDVVSETRQSPRGVGLWVLLEDGQGNPQWKQAA